MVLQSTTGKATSKTRQKKTCNECGRRLSAYKFNKKQAVCKQCFLKLKKARTNLAREFIYEYLMTHPCVDCGEKNPIVLEFDHKKDKVDCVGEIARRNGSLKAVKDEIAKCEVRCANCHRIKTAQSNGSWIFNVHNN